MKQFLIALIFFVLPFVSTYDKPKTPSFNKLKKSLLVFSMLLLMPFAMALESYNSTGDQENDFRVGTNNFNSQNTDPTITGQVGVTDAKLGVLVQDLNADGVTEVIILDSGSIKILANSTLTPITSFGVGSSTDITSNIELFDIDGDSNIEIIIFNQNNNEMHILEFDGSTLTDERNNAHNITSDYEDGDAIIKCSAQDQCIIISADDIESANLGGGIADLNARFFDSTSISTSFTNIETDVTTNKQFCAPSIREIALGEVDSTNSGLEYVSAFMMFSPTAVEELWLSRLDFSDPPLVTSLTITDFEGETINHHSGVSSTQCDVQYIAGNLIGRSLGETFTSPAIINQDGFLPQLEIVVASLVNNDEFRAGLFNMPSGVMTEIAGGSMPQNFLGGNLNADGEILSNIFVAEVLGFTDTGFGSDFCVAGFHETDQELNIMCGNPARAEPFEGPSEEYVFDYNNFWNHSSDDIDGQDYSNMVHTSRVLSGTEDLTTGFLTGFGIFTLDTADSPLVFEFSNSLMLNNPSSCIMVDAEQVGAEDLICVNDGLIFYQDDGVENGVASFVAPLSFNPCYQEPIKVNSTLEIMVTVQDNNPVSFGFQDNVNINATVYDGTAFAQTIPITGLNSGTTWPFSFVLNQTSSSFIKLQAWDDANPDEIALLTFPLTVATSGLETGDSSCDFIIDEEEEEIVPILPGVDDDASTSSGLTTGIVGISNQFNISPLIIWLIVMAVVAAVVISGQSVFGDKSSHIGARISIVAVIEFILLIIGEKLGIIPVGIIIIMTILMLIVFSLVLRNMFVSDTR